MIGRWLELWLSPVVALAIRLYMAAIFFQAGWTRINSWDQQTFLFQDIHPVPFLPPALAAPITTAGELVLSVLLALGLFGRLAALGMLAMTAVIQFVAGQTPQGLENHIANPVHYAWMLMLLAIVAWGPGALSLDRLLGHRRLQIAPHTG